MHVLDCGKCSFEETGMEIEPRGVYRFVRSCSEHKSLYDMCDLSNYEDHEISEELILQLAIQQASLDNTREG